MSNDTNNEWVRMAREAYNASSTYFDSSIRTQVEAAIRQFQGLHPKGSKYLADTGRSRLFRPKTRTTIRKNEAVAAEAFFTTTDTTSVTAQDDNDPAHQASASIMQELLQYRLTKSIPWFLTLIGAYQDSLTVGVVISHQCWKFDAKKKIDKPDIELIPVENFRFDAAADWRDPINSSPYNIQLVPMYLKDVRARMKTVNERTGEAKWLDVPEETLRAGVTQYGDSTRLQREQGRTDSKDQQQAITDYSIVWVHKNIVEKDGEDWLYYTLGTTTLLSKPVKLVEQYAHGKRPYVLGISVLETHKNYPGGLPQISKDVQAEINDVANLRIDNVKFALNKRYFVKRNKQVDIRSLVRNVAGSATLMEDPEGDVKTVEFNDVTGSAYQEQDRLNLDFDDVTGSFSGASVQSNRKLNETVGGMQLLDGSANQVSGYQLRTFVETWVEPVLRQIVLLEQYYETDEKIIALAGRKAKLFERFGINTVTDALLEEEVTLTVNVGMGATNPTEQVNRFTQAMGSLRDILADGTLSGYGLKVNEVVTELFGKLGYKDGARFFDMDAENPETAALKLELTKLQQQLAQKTPPELIEAQVKKIEAEIASMQAKDAETLAKEIKTMVEAQFSAMQSAEVLTAVPGVAPVADALMVAAGAADPNFIAGQDTTGALGIDPIKNKKSGIGFLPNGAVEGDTSPNTPANPASPGVGAAQGIETPEADSVGLNDGGMVINEDYDQSTQYANGGPVGGMLTGPGTGTSDSIPAVIEPGGQPAAVSSGEFHLPQSVVDAVGIDLLQALIQQYHTPAEGEPMPGTGDPVTLQGGDFIVPADVVDAVGPDFFQELMARYGSQA